MTVATPAGSAAADRFDAALLKTAGIVVLGAMASLLDTTIVNVALGTLGRELHASVATIQWVTTGYLLALAIVIPLSGWAIDRFGARRVWLVSLTAFLAGSVMCGLAWSVGVLIACRVLQGIGGGLLLPTAQTVLTRAAGPRRLTRAMALIGVPVQFAPIIGPVIGGLIVVNVSWRWIFFVNVPVCLLAIFVAWRGLHPEAGHRGRALDVVGLALLSPGLAAVVDGFAQAGAKGGFAAPTVIASLLAGVVLLGAFARHALTTRREPIIDLRLFRVGTFRASASIMFLGGVSIFGSMLLLPLYEQLARGRTALQAGLLLVPQGVGTLIALIVMGKLGDRLPPRATALTGLGLAAAGTVPYAFVGAHTSEWLLGTALVVRGAGLGFAIVTIMAAGFIDLRSEQVPRAASAVRIFQQVGGSLGTAVLAVILARHIGSDHAPAHVASAFATTFWWALGLTVLAVLPALELPRHRRQAGTVSAAGDIPPDQPDRLRELDVPIGSI